MIRRASVCRLATRLPAALLLLAGLLAGGAARAGEDDRKPEPIDVGQLRLAVEHRVGALTIRQYELPCLAHLSYLLAVGESAVVVDPVCDVDTYLEDAAALGCEVKAVVLTHVPFDVVAGHRALREKTGATVLLHLGSEASFEHVGVKDGHEEELGDVRLEFWSTPGHTPGSLSVLVHAPGTPVDPAYALTGGALGVGGIGRTDLAGDGHPVQAHADRAFDTVQRLKLLPDDTRLCPGIADGSRCGVDLAPGTMSTMGRERQANPFLGADSRSAFVGRLLDGLPPRPASFAAVHAANLADVGPGNPPSALPAAVTPSTVASEIRASGAVVVDLRSDAAYAGRHVEGSLNFPLLGPFETLFGTIVAFDRDVYVVGADEEVREAQRRLHRVAYPGFAGRVAGGVDAWKKSALPVRSSDLVDPKHLHRRMAAWIEPVLVDVRSAREYAKRRLPNVVHAPIPGRAKWPELFAKDRPLVFVCKTDYRSTLAIGFAEQLGFTRIGSLDGGVIRWVKLGLPLVEMVPAVPPLPPPPTPKR